MKKEISSKQRSFAGTPFENRIGFARAVRSGKHFVVAGTAPMDQAGKTEAPGDAYGQMKRCISIVQKAIEDLGGELKDVTRTRILLKSIEDWELAAKAHQESFANIRPVTTVFSVNRFINEEWLVELEAEGILSED